MRSPWRHCHHLIHAELMIWFCIFACIAGGFFVSFSFLKAANEADSGVSPNRVTAYRWAGYIFLALTIIFCLVILAMSNQIRLAIEVMKEEIAKNPNHSTAQVSSTDPKLNK